MSTAPRIDIDPVAFWADPYPMLATLRKEAPIAFVPQLGPTLQATRDDISISKPSMLSWIGVFHGDVIDAVARAT